MRKNFWGMLRRSFLFAVMLAILTGAPALARETWEWVEEPEPAQTQRLSGIKIGMSAQTDRAIAEFVTDGCNMGIKTLCRGMNQFKNAGSGAKQACGRLVNLEDKLSSELRLYL